MPLGEGMSIFAFGDAPLPKTEDLFLHLPSIGEARQLLKTYFDFAFPTHRFLHQPTVEVWLEEFYRNKSSPAIRPGARERFAIVLLVLAHATLYSPNRSTDGRVASDSANLYAASENQLSRETGGVRLSAVQARLAQCFYFLAQSRVNQCWNLFGTTTRLALAIGIHRKQQDLPRQSDTAAIIDQECRRRTLWAAYSLDNYLGAQLGRPRALHDRDIDQDLPLCIDDHLLTSNSSGSPNPQTGVAQSVMLAPIYHAKLSRIMSIILTKQYGVTRLSWDEQVSLTVDHLKLISDWRCNITDFLDAQWSTLGIMKHPFQRQCTVLNLASCYTIILTTRPLLLYGKRSLQTSSAEKHGQARESMRVCLDAAVRIIKIVHNLCSKSKMFEAFWFTYYYTFTALMVLYVFIIEHRSEAEEDWQTHLAQADACSSALSKTVPSSSFAARYGVVLEELRREASRRLALGDQSQAHTRIGPENASNHARDTRRADAAVNHEEQQYSGLQHSFSDFPFALQDQEFDVVSPSSFLAGVSGWQDIDTLLNPVLDLGTTDWSMTWQQHPGPSMT
ncbi:fungal specific transcription factor domain-containing protein 67 [Elsinoe australis]|uniref:Fungal specific transcription factor domain-containing protein 67 n=1 Tax=Elsinoe australis TaxID=40998 RepID=A0A4U7AS32_9PEZI|nr:fungal specific transcription factor domain-containing protein 67 [Elsinoe australis]